MNEEARDYARMIHNAFHNEGGKFEVIIHKTSKSNMTWRYSVRLWYVSPSTNLVEFWHLNGAIAHLTGQKLTKDGYLTGNGVGTERSFQVVYELGWDVAKYGYVDPANLHLGHNEQKNNGYQFNRYTLTA